MDAKLWGDDARLAFACACSPRAAGGYCARCDRIMGARLHGIPRAEWVQRFQARIRARTGMDAPGTDWLPAAAADVVQAELGSWPEEGETRDASGDWREELPEDAADSNLEAWSD